MSRLAIIGYRRSGAIGPPLMPCGSMSPNVLKKVLEEVGAKAHEDSARASAAPRGRKVPDRSP
jgi:hypothetical protein